MAEFEGELLANEVAKYECLYDMSCPDFKDIHMKALVWTQIGKTLQMDPAEAKTKWRSIRDRYIREKKREDNEKRSGAACSTKKEWALMPFLAFLNKTVKPRATFGNVVLPVNRPTSNQPIPTMRSPVPIPISSCSSVQPLRPKFHASYISISPSPSSTRPSSSSVPKFKIIHTAPVPSSSTLTLPSKIPFCQAAPIQPTVEQVSQDRPTPQPSQPTATTTIASTPSSKDGNPKKTKSSKRTQMDALLTSEQEIIKQLKSPSDNEVYTESERYMLSLAPILDRLEPRLRAKTKIDLQTLLFNAEFGN